MRVISGKYRGLNLYGFEGTEIRPTADRVKESLFNILSDRVIGARVLDLFCGSGSLGIECISRGAQFVHFNDRADKSVSLLKRNLTKLKGEQNYCVTKSDYRACLAGLKTKFDIIFIDPPYADESGADALALIAERGLLREGGVAIYERDRAFCGDIKGLEVTDSRKYGITYLTFFRPKEIE